MKQRRNFLKIFLLTIVTIATINFSKAQNNLGVGTATPHVSAKLDVTSTTQGMLVPRMDSLQRTLIVTPATGLLVYQTNAKPGFYFYNGTMWLMLITPAATSFSQLEKITQAGKTGFRILGSDTTFNFSTGDKAINLSYNDGDEGNGGTPGFNSFATGIGTLASGTSATAMGRYSKAIGFNATVMGATNIANGTFSTAMGVSNIANGDYSTVMGAYSIASGNYSSSIGTNLKAKSANEVTIGFFNDTLTAVNATAWANDSNRVFTVGNGAAFATRSTAFVIQQNGNIGINQRRPTEKLDITGSIKIVDGTQGSGKVLTSDANGKASWANAGALPFFKVSTADTNHIIYNTKNNYGKNFIINADSVNKSATDEAKMMFIPSKYAFRAGKISNNNWNLDSIGAESASFGHNSMALGGSSMAAGYLNEARANASIALGQQNVASGFAAVAMGFFNNATNSASFATGLQTTASGNSATAMGTQTNASGYASTAMGNNTKASGFGATSMGNNTIASGSSSFATGLQTTALGYASTAMGFNSRASGDFSVTIGGSTFAKSYSETVIGVNNDTLRAAMPTNFAADSNRLFTVGNGFSANTRNTAFVVQQDGNVGVGDRKPTSRLDVNGALSLPINTTLVSLTLNNTHHTVILGSSNIAITLPIATTCEGRIYKIVTTNTATSCTISSYANYSNAATTTLTPATGITIQSDGLGWRLIP